MSSIIAIGTAVFDTILTSDKTFDEAICNKVSRSFSDGGAIRNVAHNLTLLKDDVLLWAKFGNDMEALDMIGRLESLGIQVHAKIIDMPSPHFYQLFDADSSMMISSTTDDFYFNSQDTFPSFLLHNEAFGITDQDDPEFLRNLIKRHPRLRWIALGFLPPSDLQSSFFAVFVNRKEALRNAESIDKFLAESKSIPLSVVTLDKHGLLYTYEGQTERLAAPVMGNGNALGMGDALVSGFLHSYLKGFGIESSLTFGIECARQTSEVTTAINPALSEIIRL